MKTSACKPQSANISHPFQETSTAEGAEKRSKAAFVHYLLFPCCLRPSRRPLCFLRLVRKTFFVSALRLFNKNSHSCGLTPLTYLLRDFCISAVNSATFTAEIQRVQRNRKELIFPGTIRSGRGMLADVVRHHPQQFGLVQWGPSMALHGPSIFE